MTDIVIVNILRAICGVLIALPATLQLVPDLGLSPASNAALLVMALVGGTVMSQLPPVGKPPEHDALLREIESLTPTERRVLAQELERRAIPPNG